MKLTGDLEKQVQKAETREEAKDVIEKAGMQLSDDELDNVAGGMADVPIFFISRGK